MQSIQALFSLLCLLLPARYAGEEHIVFGDVCLSCLLAKNEKNSKPPTVLSINRIILAFSTQFSSEWCGGLENIWVLFDFQGYVVNVKVMAA